MRKLKKSASHDIGFICFTIVLFSSGCSISPLYSDKNGGSNINVDVIADREGQQLRRYLKDKLRDLNITSKNHRLTITLQKEEKPFAETTDDNAQRVEVRYIAHVILKNSENEVVFKNDFITTTSNNISTGHGDVIFSLYGRNNTNLLNELSIRIVEGIRVYLNNEK